MARNLDRLSRLTAQMLDTTRLEAGGTGERHLVRLGATLKSWSDQWEQALSSKGLCFEVTGADTDELIVLVNPEGFESVMFNLLSNAFKYTPAPGWVKLHWEVAASQVTPFQI